MEKSKIKYLEKEAACEVTGKQEEASRHRRQAATEPTLPTHEYMHIITCTSCSAPLLQHKSYQRRDCLLARELGTCALQPRFWKRPECWGLGDLQNSWGSEDTSCEGRCWGNHQLLSMTASFKTLGAEVCRKPGALLLSLKSGSMDSSRSPSPSLCSSCSLPISSPSFHSLCVCSHCVWSIPQFQKSKIA